MNRGITKSLIAACLMLSTHSIVRAQTDSILWLGNSYTYTSDLPGTFSNLAAEGGHVVYSQQYTPGGKQLNQHAVDATTLSNINSRQWDYVVLQEQSQMPYINPGNTVTSAQTLRGQIKNNNSCTEVVIYATWARQAGNSWLISTGQTHESMALIYENFYDDFWQYTAGRVSAVGMAFHEATRQGINVYSGDGSHQNANGTYLAACVFYATIYQESPVGFTYSIASNNTIRDQLQQIAHNIVFEDLYQYNIKKVRFNMNQTDINAGETINFSEWVFVDPWPPTFNWTFEGANISNSNLDIVNGVQFDTVGQYDVTLSITDQCGYQESRTYSDTIKVGSPVTGIGSELDQNLLYPTSLQVYTQSINVPENKSIEVYDLTGKKVRFTQLNNLLTIHEERQLYLVKVIDLNGSRTYKVIVAN